MENPYEPPKANEEVGGGLPPPQWLSAFRDPTNAANWLSLVCLAQAGIAAVMYFGGWRRPEVYFICNSLLWLTLPIVLLALLPFARITTANARLFLAEPLQASGYWPWWLVFPMLGSLFAYSHMRRVAIASGTPMSHHLAVPWLGGLAMFFLLAFLPFGGGGYFFLGLGQLCLLVAARRLCDGQLRLVRLASVAQVLIDARSQRA